MGQDSSLLLGIEGLVVDRVVIEDDRRVVHCSTDPELAGWCPECRQQSSSPKDRVTTRLLSVGDSADVAVIENADGFCGFGRHGDADRCEVTPVRGDL